VQTYVKDPDAKLPYVIDWQDWLPVGDTIAASTWDIDADLTNGTDEFTDTTATILLSGGTAGESYTVTNHITTATGLEDDRSFILKIRER
jgi:hypothetical protein